MSAPGLLEACADARLFGFPLWPRQEALLAGLERGPRIQVWSLGRRSGKTTMASVAALHNCLFRPDLDELVRVGETRYAVAVATNLAQGRLLVSAARSIVERSPLLAPLLERATEDELHFRLPSGARTALKAFPCSSRGARGYPVSLLVMDEAAHFVAPEDVGGHQTAARVWEALVPATAQFGAAARVVVSSTPWGRHGLFAEMFTRANAGELEDAVARRAATQEMNPTITDRFLELERARDPDSFRAEYLAEFLDSGAAFLESARVRAAALEPLELPPGEVVAPVAALDAAFSRDPFALAIVGRDRSVPKRLRLALVRSWQPERSRELDMAAVLADVAEICRRYSVGLVLVDQYASAPVRQHLARLGVTAMERTMSLPSKTAIYVALKAKLYAGELELRAHEGLVAELERIEVHYAAGTQSIRIPRVGGSHGDLAQAAALAIHELAKVGGMGGKLLIGQNTLTGSLARDLDGESSRRERPALPSGPMVDGDGVLVEGEHDV